MRINPVTIKMSAHVAKRLAELVERQLGKREDNTLETALDELNAALAERE